jgi:GAF domain-containing protein
MSRPQQPTPVEVYRTALARLMPAVGASFASIFLRDDRDPDLLRLTCALNWPQSSARFLADLRIREGRGPTGRAVSTGSPVQVADVFEDPGLEDWWQPARELGFVSTVAVPVTAEGRVIGAVSFYFSERAAVQLDADALVDLVARELEAAARR